MGTTITRTGVICGHSAEAVAALLGVAGQWDEGAELPPMWHLTHLLDVWPQSAIGPDGHPAAGVPSPPAPGARRMFAGGRTWHLAPLRIGEPAVRITRIGGTRVKRGGSGELTFVTVRHQIEQRGTIAILEEQDIVYRPAWPEGSPPLPRTAGPAGDTTTGTGFDIDPTVLFRFSALTCNAHRIHYDHRYANAEGYADLVVQGPLQVILMAEHLGRSGLRLGGLRFSYRLTAPAIGPQRLTVRAQDAGAEVRAGDGTLVARSEVGAARVPALPSRERDEMTAPGGP